MKAIALFYLLETDKIWSTEAARKNGFKLVSVKEYAKLSGYSPRAIRNYAQCGKLEAFKESKTWFICVPIVS
jgi:hypothetical protein